MFYKSYYHITPGVTLLFEPPKRPLVSLNGILSPKRPKIGCFTLNIFRKAHLGSYLRPFGGLKCPFLPTMCLFGHRQRSPQQASNPDISSKKASGKNPKKVVKNALLLAAILLLVEFPSSLNTARHPASNIQSNLEEKKFVVV